jgi:hypothetical protein
MQKSMWLFQHNAGKTSINYDSSKQTSNAKTYFRFSPIRQVLAPAIIERIGALLSFDVIERLAKSL